MSSKSARREYLQALAAFDRACVDFSKGMSTVLASPAPLENTPQPLLADLGPRKPAKRAQRVPHAQAKRAL